jgi:hypothetical protein
MNLILITMMSVGIPLAALGLHDLQESVERRAQRRHAND